MSSTGEDVNLTGHVHDGGCCDVLLHHLDARKRNRKTRFIILYGSETGNSKSIAERIHEQAISRSIAAKLGTLDEYEELGVLGDEPTFGVIVVSTTGNGDAPKGAEKLFRYVKKRTHAADTIRSLSYAVLALGDSNYDKFCFVGRTVDARLGAIGAKQLSPVVCVDEVLGLEAQVEPWIDSIWNLYASLDSSATISTPQRAVGASISVGSPASIDKKRLEADSENQTGINTPAKESKTPVAVQAATLSAAKGYVLPAHFDGFESLGNSGPHTSATAAVTATKSLPRSREPFVSSRFAPPKSAFRPAHMVHAEVLTRHFPGEDDRVVIRATLDLAEEVRWDVGDAIAIRCPNPHVLVEAVARRLGLDLDAIVSEGEETWTVRGVLTHGVDLHTPPKKSFLRTLSMFCTDDLDRARMDLLSSLGGKVEYERLVEAQRLSVLEVLQLFPSCKPSLDHFLGALGPSPPPERAYSFASSPLDTPAIAPEHDAAVHITATSASGSNNTPNRADICFSVVRTRLSERRVVCGACTTQLEAMALSLMSGNSGGECVLMTQVKPNASFKLPADETRPVIMVGPGTGVAPFMGFIRHRPATLKSRKDQMKASAPVCGAWRGGLDFEDELEQADDALVVPFKCRTPDAPIGASTLYFGCRRPEQDFLFKEELTRLEELGALSKLRVAFSRVEPKKYVQNLMLEDSAELAECIVQQGAYVYVCGDGTKMAKDVQATVVEILASKGGMDAVQAKTYLEEMQKRGRYVQDIW